MHIQRFKDNLQSDVCFRCETCPIISCTTWPLKPRRYTNRIIIIIIIITM